MENWINSMTHVSPEMFENIVETTINEIVEESEYNDELKLAILTSIQNDKIVIGDYSISKNVVNLWGVSKTFYDIYSDDYLEIENIGSSNILIKIIIRLLNKKSINQNDPLTVLNAKYVGVLSDSLYYKSRILTTHTNTITKNIYQAKYDGCMYQLQRLNDQIKKIS